MLNAPPAPPPAENPPAAVGAARRTAIGLLGLDHVFSQRDLLTVEQFLQEAERRGVNLQVGHLEALHHSGHLIPLFRVRLDRRMVVEATRPGHYEMPALDTSPENLKR